MIGEYEKYFKIGTHEFKLIKPVSELFTSGEYRCEICSMYGFFSKWEIDDCNRLSQLSGYMNYMYMTNCNSIIMQSVLE